MAVPETFDNAKLPKAVLGVRHFQVFMLTLGVIFASCLKVSMSIAIVAMTDTTKNNTFDWNHQTQSVILSSFKWGYIVLMVPAGELSARYGGMLVLIICIAANSLGSLILPLGGIYGGWQLICACRVVQGLAQGLLIPAIHNLISKWVPVDETSCLGTIIYAGGQLGSAVQMMISGFIANSWGWPAIFYVNGIFGVAWTIVYIVLGSDSPQTSKIISKEERFYIQSSLGQVGGYKKVSTPWKAMLTSSPFIALIIAHVGFGWGYWTLLTEMPTYMKKVLDIDIKSNGMLSALPYLVAYFFSFPMAFASDYISRNKWVSLTTNRKIFNTLGTFIAAIFLIALSYSSDIVTAVTLLTAAVVAGTAYFAGCNLVHLDMAPNHAGTMAGITSFCSNSISLAAPLTAGFLIRDESSANEWREIFFLAAAIYCVSNVVFLVFGTSRRQDWNQPLEIPTRDGKY